MPANPLFPQSQSQKVSNIWNTMHAAADEGNFFVATNPTVGTGIAITTSIVDDAATASSTHAQFAPSMLIQSGYTLTDPNARTHYPLYLRMIVTAAPTSASVWNLSIRTDNIARYSSGGSTISPVNVNTSSANTSPAKIYFGAIVPLALPSSNSRLVANMQIQSSIPVVKDEWLFLFGHVGVATSILTASAAKNMTNHLPPVIVGPGMNMAIDMWGASNAGAAAFEFEYGYVERFAGQ